MSEKLQMPDFASEEEEADWWYDNREVLSDQFVEAFDEGRVKVNGMSARLAAARGVPVLDLATGDIVKARALADQRGMEVSKFLSMLVHEALEREPPPTR